MFIYSLRASTLKFFTVTTLAVAALVTLLFFIPSAQTAPVASYDGIEVDEQIKLDKIKTASDRVGFLSSLGWEVDPASAEESEVTIPAEFDKVYKSYNELQREQGFDLTKYHKKSVMRYTYKVTNYPDYDGDVLATILIYKNRVIGGDICSADANGFIRGICPTA